MIAGYKGASKEVRNTRKEKAVKKSQSKEHKDISGVCNRGHAKTMKLIEQALAK
jgi:hypothetical protein